MNDLAEVQAILRTNSLVVQVFTGNAAPLTAAAFLEPYSASRLCGIRRIDLLEIQQIPAQGSPRFRLRFSHPAATSHAYQTLREGGQVYVEADLPKSTRTLRYEACQQLKAVCSDATSSGSFIKYRYTKEEPFRYVKAALADQVSAAVEEGQRRQHGAMLLLNPGPLQQQQQQQQQEEEQQHQQRQQPPPPQLQGTKSNQPPPALSGILHGLSQAAMRPAEEQVQQQRQDHGDFHLACEHGRQQQQQQGQQQGQQQQRAREHAKVTQVKQPAAAAAAASADGAAGTGASVAVAPTAAAATMYTHGNKRYLTPPAYDPDPQQPPAKRHEMTFLSSAGPRQGTLGFRSGFLLTSGSKLLHPAAVAGARRAAAARETNSEGIGSVRFLDGRQQSLPASSDNSLEEEDQ